MKANEAGPASAAFPAARARLRFAGAVPPAAWAGLAWRSHGGGAPLGWMLATMAVAWAALAWAWRARTGGAAREILWFALGFRLVAFWATPVMEDDYHRFLWDGYRFAVTGNSYAEAPEARFANDTIPAEIRAVLDQINHPDVPTVYGPLTQWAFRANHAVAPAWWFGQKRRAAAGAAAGVQPRRGGGRVGLAQKSKCPAAVNNRTGVNREKVAVGA